MKSILKILFIILLYPTQSISQDFWQQANEKNTEFNNNTPSKAESTTTIDSTLAQHLQDTLDYIRSSKNIKGVSTAVIIPDQGTWTGVSGASHFRVEITQDMLFGIGSITKSYTAALILKLAEEGILTLDDSLHKWLPAYDNIASTITIRQLLNMTSGIYDFANDNDSFDDSLFSDLTRLWTPEEILTSLVGKPNSSPGDTFGYSNTNYIILGMIIKEATGSMVSVELRNRFLDPMDLNRTHLAGEEILIGETAHPWNGWTGVLEDYSFINDTANFSLLWTMGGMFSTARDVAQWAQALYGGAVLNQEYLDQMVTFTPIDDPISPPEWTGYGLGTFQFNILDRELWGHAGVWYGNVALVAYLPGDGISIAVLINENYWGSYPVLMRNVHDILAVLLGFVLNFDLSSIADEGATMPVDLYTETKLPKSFQPNYKY
jgi:D-alanyl-D-alanine carboxypeptidase